MEKEERIKVDDERAKELATKWANQAVKRHGEITRETWLWAYDRYDFSDVDPKIQGELANTASSFREWIQNKKELKK